jgi:hypothetical protein
MPASVVDAPPVDVEDAPPMATLVPPAPLAAPVPPLVAPPVAPDAPPALDVVPPAPIPPSIDPAMHDAPEHTYPAAQSALAVHCCWHAPLTHRYPLQELTVPCESLTLSFPTHVAPAALHVPAPLDVSQTATRRQSAFVVQLVSQACALASQV